MNTKYLDKALARMKERVTLERLAEHVPAIKQRERDFEALVQIMHRVAAIVQSHELTIRVDTETGKTFDGHDPEEAQDIVKRAFYLLRETALKYQ